MNAVLILGNPNSGKSLLFNRLTGLSHKVANFPGVTVEVRSGKGEGFMFSDLPGIYSLNPLTRDEIVAVDQIRDAIGRAETRGLLYVMDATRFERSLFLLLQTLEEARAKGCPVCVALNIIDELFAKGARIDAEGLGREIGVPVIPVSARTGQGLTELKAALACLPRREVPTTHLEVRPVHPESPTHKETLMVVSGVAASPTVVADTQRTATAEFRTRVCDLARRFGPQGDVLLVGQNRLDNFFLSTFWGLIAFFGIMVFLFQAIFSWAAPFMDAISNVISSSGSWVAAHLPPGIVADFVQSALFEGIGSFLVFAPQIFILSLIIGVLEDSGYLARTAIMFHRPLRAFGLTGRAFVPLLSGHACAIPAVLAARTIESPRRRLMTICAIPFMSCSARIPVYALLIAGFVPAVPILGRALTLQGLSFFMLYALGLVMGLLAAGFISWMRRNRQSARDDAPFVVELPPYRVPSLKPLIRQASNRTWDFIRGAGGMIFAVTVTIWFLGYFPNGSGHLDTSYLGRMGHAIEGFFRPMGMDWKIGVGVLTSFLAREVFVGTLGTLYGIENAGDNTQTLSQTLQANGMTLATACALLVFYALSMQCVATLAVIKKETGSWKVPTYLFVGMTLLAYAAAALTYSVLA